MIEILNLNCTELTPGDLPPFASVISDPPYSPHVHENTTSIGSNGEGAQHRDLGFAAITPEGRAHLAALASGASRWFAVFSDTESTHLWREAIAEAPPPGLRYVRSLPWIRWSQPQLSGDRPPTGHEMITLAHRHGPMRWNGAGNLTHYDCGPVRFKGKHPTQKPLDLMLGLVSAFSDPGELVIDPYAGSGTTILACRLLGRDGIGVEAGREHWQAARKRVGAALSDHDYERAALWATATIDEAQTVPHPKKKSQVKTWERAQRRLADARTVLATLAP